MDKAKVYITNKQKAVKLPVGLKLLIRKSCTAVLIEEDFEGSAEVSVSLVDEDEIRALNKEYRGIDEATDVLSFPLGDESGEELNPETGAKMLGDVIISAPRAFRQAEEYGHSIQREIAFLTVHSMLHLLGYDHVGGGIEAVRMREKEEKVLQALGLARNGSYYMED